MLRWQCAWRDGRDGRDVELSFNDENWGDLEQNDSSPEAAVRGEDSMAQGSQEDGSENASTLRKQ